MAVHFNSKEHSATDFEFIDIECVVPINTDCSLESILLTREVFWSAQLCILFPHVLKKTWNSVLNTELSITSSWFIYIQIFNIVLNILLTEISTLFISILVILVYAFIHLHCFKTYKSSMKFLESIHCRQNVLNHS